MTETQLEALIGPGAMRDYAKATETEQRQIEAWAPALQGLTDEDFVDLCTVAVAQGAKAESMRSLELGLHIRASACIYEARRRHIAAGHSSACKGDDLYTEGFNRARGHYGFEPGSPIACTCGFGE